MSKKNLDKLFREKFKDFEDVPDEKVWNTIETSLNKKRKKRVIPLWWKLGGVAAVLALGLIIWNPFSNGVETISTITQTEKENTDESDMKRKDQEDTFQLPKTTNETVVEKSADEQSSEAGSNQVVSEDAFTEGVLDKAEKEADATQSQVVVNESSSTNTGSTGSEGINRTTDSSPVSKDVDFKRSQITATNQKTNTDSEIDKSVRPKKGTSDILDDRKKEAIADAASEKFENNSTAVPKNSEGIAQIGDADQNSDKRISATTEETVVQNDPKTSDSNTGDDPKKKSIFEEIEAQNEETDIAEESQGRWSAGPSIAPVYFNAVGEGSPVHSIFAPNSKSGNTNMSYGLSVAFAVNKKLRVRSGIHRVDYGYDTDGVAFSSSLQTAASERIENIDYTTTAKNLVVKSQASALSNAEAATNDAVAFEVSEANNASRDGTMAQQFGYLEVPLELDYALIDRKFGVNLVGGFSSLFLLDNSVTLNSGDLTTEIGEANNVNNVNFSTNIGFGVNYKFSPKIQLNIEPVFKYQLNTFSDIAGDFRPFSLGVYSGLNFRF